MKFDNLMSLTGKVVKDWFTWLQKDQEGCCSIWFDSTGKYRYVVCMGWHHYDDEPVLDESGNHVRENGFAKFKPVWKVAWKIGRQTHNNIMQCDFDLDFEMPYVTEKMAKESKSMYEGDVDDTVEVVECEKIIPKSFSGSRKEIPVKWSAPIGYRSWNDLAATMRKTARRVFRDWKDHDD